MLQSLQEYPVREVLVPHTHAMNGEGLHIPIYYQLPPGASAQTQFPVVIIFTGLDGYRTELAVWAEGWRRLGVGLIVVEIPGTGDSPALANDPTSPDRLWTSLLDWVETQDGINKEKLCVWGFSTGGYYAIRAAHTHHDRLAGVVSHGGGCHHMFDPEWLSEVNHLEYPFEYDLSVCVLLFRAAANPSSIDKPCRHLIPQVRVWQRR
jgi:dienelactone hydrolase